MSIFWPEGPKRLLDDLQATMSIARICTRARIANRIIGSTLRIALTKAELMVKKVPDRNARNTPYHLVPSR